ncbi:MAG: hypothetical protein WC551_02675 [Patescibacteria group bacterium]
MEISQFETEIKELDKDLRLVPHPHNTDVVGIYWRSIHVGSIPSGNIYDEKRDDYQDANGYKHKTRPEALAQIKSFLWRLDNEKDFLETMTEPL